MEVKSHLKGFGKPPSHRLEEIEQDLLETECSSDDENFELNEVANVSKLRKKKNSKVGMLHFQ